MLATLFSVALISVPAMFGSTASAPRDDGADTLCRPPFATFNNVFQSEKVVLFVVSKVEVEADPFPDDDLHLVRGTYELTPLATIKGAGNGERKSFMFDATLSKDAFLGISCRWSLQPVHGAIWIGSGSLDGEDCASCDNRLDAQHKLDWLGPLTDFTGRH